MNQLVAPPRAAFETPQPLASDGEFKPVYIGNLKVWPPVVLAPMAGVTNAPFRSLCRSYGAGLYVNEMITARAIVEENPKTMRMASFAPDEWPRSIQLYGTDAYSVGEATRRLIDTQGVDHIDINFGCPMKKVTRQGGGAALPWKRSLCRSIVRAAVVAAGDIPVTLKFRVGIDDSTTTFLDTARIAEQEGCRAVALHARTANQMYSGAANWDRIAELKSAVSEIPVLGNGDIWEANDALKMMRSTGADGVVIGRGCLGRPWLFADLARAFTGQELLTRPNLGTVADGMLKHAELLCDTMVEPLAIRNFRKHTGWYLKGFAIGGETRLRFNQVGSLEELKSLLDDLDRKQPFPKGGMRLVRGHHGPARKVHLPDGWLNDRDDVVTLANSPKYPVSGG